MAAQQPPPGARSNCWLVHIPLECNGLTFYVAALMTAIEVHANEEVYFLYGGTHQYDYPVSKLHPISGCSPLEIDVLAAWEHFLERCSLPIAQVT